MKKSTIILAFITIFGIVGALFTSCKKDDPITQENYIIKVDSIFYPDTISAADTLKIKFYGLVGENSCYQFAQWDPNYGVDFIQLTTMGIHYLNQNCTDGIIYLNGAEFKLSGIPVGTYTVKIIQPDNTSMESQLYVKQ